MARAVVPTTAARRTIHSFVISLDRAGGALRGTCNPSAAQPLPPFCSGGGPLGAAPKVQQPPRHGV